MKNYMILIQNMTILGEHTSHKIKMDFSNFGIIQEKIKASQLQKM